MKHFDFSMKIYGKRVFQTSVRNSSFFSGNYKKLFSFGKLGFSDKRKKFFSEITIIFFFKRENLFFSGKESIIKYVRSKTRIF